MIFLNKAYEVITVNASPRLNELIHRKMRFQVKISNCWFNKKLRIRMKRHNTLLNRHIVKKIRAIYEPIEIRDISINFSTRREYSIKILKMV